MTAANTIEERVSRLHAGGLVDLHFDLPLGLFLSRPRRKVIANDFLPEFEAGDVSLLGAAVYVEDRHLDQALRVALDQVALLNAELAVTPRSDALQIVRGYSAGAGRRSHRIAADHGGRRAAGRRSPSAGHLLRTRSARDLAHTCAAQRGRRGRSLCRQRITRDRPNELRPRAGAGVRATRHHPRPRTHQSRRLRGNLRSHDETVDRLPHATRGITTTSNATSATSRSK